MAAEPTPLLGISMVEDAEIDVTSIALPERITSGIHAIESIECVLVTLHAGECAGCGYAFCFSPQEATSIEAIAHDLVDHVRGQPAHLVRRTYDTLWRRTNFIGHGGPPLMALSAFDMAGWDLTARLAGQPLYRMLGAVRDEVRVYSAGGWLSLDVDGLCAQAVAVKEAGFPAYKMRAGNRDWRTDVARIQAVRAAIGPEMLLMVDVNQAWDVPTAIKAGRALEECELSWLEEPVDVHDIRGCARVAAAIEVPVAGGETVWGPYGLLELLRHEAVSILQPDLMRCGGITGFVTVASAADLLGVSVVSHLYTPISAHLMAAVPRSDLVEYIPGWFDGLFADAPAIRQGRIALGDSPGTGVTFVARSEQGRHR